MKKIISLVALGFALVLASNAALADRARDCAIEIHRRGFSGEHIRTEQRNCVDYRSGWGDWKLKQKAKGSNYHWNEAKNPMGSNRCSNESQCDGNRTCSMTNECVGRAR